MLDTFFCIIDELIRNLILQYTYKKAKDEYEKSNIAKFSDITQIFRANVLNNDDSREEEQK